MCSYLLHNGRCRFLPDFIHFILGYHPGFSWFSVRPWKAMWKPYIWDLTNNVDYTFWKHPSYHGMIPCLLRSHTYWSVIAHSAVAMPLVGSTATSNPPTLTLWRSWTLGTQPQLPPFKGTWGHRSPEIACLCCLTDIVLQDFYRVGHWLWPGMIGFFFFWLWRWVVNFFWPGMICIPWIFLQNRWG